MTASYGCVVRQGGDGGSERAGLLYTIASLHATSLLSPTPSPPLASRASGTSSAPRPPLRTPGLSPPGEPAAAPSIGPSAIICRHVIRVGLRQWLLWLIDGGGGASAVLARTVDGVSGACRRLVCQPLTVSVASHDPTIAASRATPWQPRAVVACWRAASNEWQLKSGVGRGAVHAALCGIPTGVGCSRGVARCIWPSSVIAADAARSPSTRSLTSSTLLALLGTCERDVELGVVGRAGQAQCALLGGGLGRPRTCLHVRCFSPMHVAQCSPAGLRVGVHKLGSRKNTRVRAPWLVAYVESVCSLRMRVPSQDVEGRARVGAHAPAS